MICKSCGMTYSDEDTYREHLPRCVPPRPTPKVETLHGGRIDVGATIENRRRSLEQQAAHAARQFAARRRYEGTVGALMTMTAASVAVAAYLVFKLDVSATVVGILMLFCCLTGMLAREAIGRGNE